MGCLRWLDDARAERHEGMVAGEDQSSPSRGVGWPTQRAAGGALRGTSPSTVEANEACARAERPQCTSVSSVWPRWREDARANKGRSILCRCLSTRSPPPGPLANTTVVSRDQGYVFLFAYDRRLHAADKRVAVERHDRYDAGRRCVSARRAAGLRRPARDSSRQESPPAHEAHGLLAGKTEAARTGDSKAAFAPQTRKVSGYTRQAPQEASPPEWRYVRTGHSRYCDRRVRR